MDEIRNSDKDPLWYFDWIMCVLFGLIAIGGFVLTIFALNKSTVMLSSLGLGLMSLAYSPLVEKTWMVRILLIVATLFVVAY